MVCYDQEPSFIAVDLRNIERYHLERGAHLFHVTDCSFRDSIMRNGLELSAGVGTSIQRTYPPRIFFSLTLSAAFEFVLLKVGAQPDNISVSETSRQQVASTIFPKYSEKDIDIYRATVQEGIEFYPDPFFPGKGVWSKVPILPKYLELIRGWRGLNDQMIAPGHHG
jgi:hypothetical protein